MLKTTIELLTVPRFGDHDEEVRLLQGELKNHGFDPGPLDGQWGTRTELAVRSFQQHYNFKVDGKLDNVQLFYLGFSVGIGSSIDLSDTPWMTWLRENEGQHEIAGPQDNPFIMSLYKYGNYPPQHDEVPWCACCANAALKINGYKGTDRADAKSFIDYGQPCGALHFGAVVVLRHIDGNHHVTFFSKFVDAENSLVELEGGNQSDSLCKKTYNVSGNAKGHDEIVAIRWPVKA